MDSLRLDGTTIRGVVQGRPINCVISSVPAGLTLPRGQYWLRAESTPIYGQHLSVEAARGPGEAAASHHFKFEAPAAINDSAASVATLVPAGQASAIAGSGDFHIKFAPGAIKDAPAGKFFDSANPTGSARVIIAVRPIAQNSLLAHAGFSDLLETVQRAGVVALIVG